MNTDTLNTVCEGDLPQKIRNVILKDRGKAEVESRVLKEYINLFLWIHLPMSTTIREAEMLACKIFELLYDFKPSQRDVIEKV